MLSTAVVGRYHPSHPSIYALPSGPPRPGFAAAPASAPASHALEVVPRVSRFERCVINLNSFAGPPGRRGTSIYSSESVRLGFEVGNLSLAGPDLIASHNPGRDGLAGTVASVSRRTTFKVKLES